jgi:hypothetical protein
VPNQGRDRTVRGTPRQGDPGASRPVDRPRT